MRPMYPRNFQTGVQDPKNILKNITIATPIRSHVVQWVAEFMHDFNDDLELRNCGQSQQRSVRLPQRILARLSITGSILFF